MSKRISFTPVFDLALLPPQRQRADFASYRTKTKRDPNLCLICHQPKVECWNDGQTFSAPPAQPPELKAAVAGAKL